MHSASVRLVQEVLECRCSIYLSLLLHCFLYVWWLPCGFLQRKCVRFKDLPVALRLLRDILRRVRTAEARGVRTNLGCEVYDLLHAPVQSHFRCIECAKSSVFVTKQFW